MKLKYNLIVYIRFTLLTSVNQSIAARSARANIIPYNTLLHFEKQKETNNVCASSEPEQQPKNNQTLESISAMVSLPNLHDRAHVFLHTAIVLVTVKSGHQRRYRSILVSGSQINAISKSLANKLKLPAINTTMPVSDIGGVDFINRYDQLMISQFTFN